MRLRRLDAMAMRDPVTALAIALAACTHKVVQARHLRLRPGTSSSLARVAHWRQSGLTHLSLRLEGRWHPPEAPDHAEA